MMRRADKPIQIASTDMVPYGADVQKGEIASFHHQLLELGQPSSVGDVFPQRYGDINVQLAKRIYSASPVVNGLISIGSQAYASARLMSKVVNRATGDSRREHTGEVARVLRYINKHMTPTEFQMTLYSWYKLVGEFYVAIEPNPDPDEARISPLSLYPMDPQYTYIVTDPETGRRGYIYEYGGATTPSRVSTTQKPKRIYLPERNVIHARNFSPHDMWLGCVDLNSLGNDLHIEQFAKRQQKKYYANAAVIHGTIETEDTIGDDEIERLKREFREQYAGAQNAYRVAVLEKGMKYKPLPGNTSDQWMSQVLDDVKDDASLVLGVPLKLFTGDYTGTSFVDLEAVMWNYNLLPFAQQVGEILTKKLALPKAQNLEICHDLSPIDAIQKMDLDKTRTDVAKVVAGLATPNEVRISRGIPRHDSEFDDFGDSPKPVYDAQVAADAATAAADAAAELAVDGREAENNPSPSASLPDDPSGRDQSSTGEAEMVDTTGEKSLTRILIDCVNASKKEA